MRSLYDPFLPVGSRASTKFKSPKRNGKIEAIREPAGASRSRHSVVYIFLVKSCVVIGRFTLEYELAAAWGFKKVGTNVANAVKNT